jgi:stage II sporulation protein D
LRKETVKRLLFSSVLFCLICCVQEPFCYAQDPASLYNRSKFNQTIKYYRKSADAGDYNGYVNLAIVLKDLGHYSQAVRVLKAAAHRFPKEPAVLPLMGRLYFLDNEPLKAIKVLRMVLETNPGDFETLLTLGLCYQDAKLDTEASEYLQKALLLDPGNVLAHLTLADVYYRSRKLQESAREYKTVNLLDASIQHFYKYWGSIHFELGNYIEAYKVYEKIRAMDPKDQSVIKRLDIISEKLGKRFFAREKEKRTAEKQKKNVFVKPLRVPAKTIYVRVGLVQAADQAELKFSTDFVIKAKQSDVLLGAGKAGQDCTVSASPDAKIVCRLSNKDTIIADEPVVIRPRDPKGTCTIFGVSAGKDDFWQSEHDRSFRGDIEVIAGGRKITVINKLSLEEYLYSVVPSEMLPKWPFEALKAQAVAARSEAMSKLGRHKSDGYDFCAEVHCQSYTGVEQETQATNLAVDDTAGMILEYKGKPVDAIYSSCCGGHTQDNIFGKDAVKYFKGTYDSLDDNEKRFPLSPFELEQWLKEPPKDILCNIPEFARSSNFRWVRVYSASEMDALASKLGDIGKVSKITVVKRNDSGHISALKLTGSRSSYLLEKELTIRKALGNLRSSMFKVEIKYGTDQIPQQFVFYGGGWGHGVGMCQAGACGMANKAKSFEEILHHYYKDVELKKIY